MRKEDKEIEKITRRKALQKGKYITKVAGAGALYGGIGNIAGRIYRIERDSLRQLKGHMYDAADSVGETLKKANPKNLYDKIRGKEITPKPKKPKKSKPTTRRGFIRKTLGLYHNHPVSTFTATGAAYGSGKHAIKGYEKHKRKSERNQDKLERIQDKLDRSEDREERKELRKEIKALRQLIQESNSNNLERLTQETEDEQYFGNPLIIIGGIGLVISIVITSVNITGHSIANKVLGAPILPLILFIASLITILVGVKENIVNKIKY